MIGLKRSQLNISTDQLWRLFLFGTIGLTLSFVTANLVLSWQKIVLFNALDFSRTVGIPAGIALFALLIAFILTYLRPELAEVRLFSLVTLACAYFLNSRPDFMTGWLFPPTLISARIGAILLPPLLLHFLLYFPYPRPILSHWPFLLPLIYLPVVPLLIYLPNLLLSAETLARFDDFIDGYIASYALVGFLSLLQAYWAGNAAIRKRALILMAGFALPVALFSLYTVAAALDLTSQPFQIYPTGAQYIFWSIPISMAFAILRYNIYGPGRISHRQVFYTSLVGLLLILYIFLMSFISSVAIGASRLTEPEVRMILATIIFYIGGRVIFHRLRRWWTERHFRYSLEDFRASLRILSQELLQVKSRRELEALISWNLAADFKIRSAELSVRNLARAPYAMSLPLSIHNVSLGTLFLGPKINGQPFTTQELAIFNEVQEQIALALLSVELDEAIRVTAELTRLKSKFLANVTHELRTPLNGIINYIGFVLDNPEQLNADQVVHLKQALTGAERLLDLINNILDMSKIEAGQMTLIKRPVDLSEVLAELEPVALELLGGKPVQYVTNIAPTLPLFVGDRMRLRQIILNMVSNASKFTERGKIQVDLYPQNGSIIIKVSDTGPGIKQAALPTIFERFATTGLIDTQELFGPGLGLPITKSLVELHHGHITVDSQPHTGTIFTVDLPLQTDE